MEGARCYLDWVLPAVLEGTEREAADAAGETDVKVKACAPVELAVFSGADLTPETSEERAEELALDVLEHWDTSRVYVPELRARLEEQMAYVYPYEDSGRMKLKFTVSELKKRSGLAEEAGQEMYEEPEVVPLLPGFLREEETLTELPGAAPITNCWSCWTLQRNMMMEACPRRSETAGSRKADRGDGRVYPPRRYPSVPPL